MAPLPAEGSDAPPRAVILRAFIERQAKRSWALPALVCLILFVLLFALAGQTVNAPFVYAPPP